MHTDDCESIFPAQIFGVMEVVVSWQEDSWLLEEETTGRVTRNWALCEELSLLLTRAVFRSSFFVHLLFFSLDLISHILYR